VGFARVVSFEGVSKERMEELDRELNAGAPPEGFPGTEIIVLHDPQAERSLVVVFFETEEDYTRGDEILSAMPVADVPGRRTSIAKYDVATRMTV
jgi:hypothetical protein